MDRVLQPLRKMGAMIKSNNGKLPIKIKKCQTYIQNQESTLRLMKNSTNIVENALKNKVLWHIYGICRHTQQKPMYFSLFPQERHEILENVNSKIQQTKSS